MAMTGYFRVVVRPRAHRPLSMLKYDPVVRKQVLFLEQKRGAGEEGGARWNRVGACVVRCDLSVGEKGAGLLAYWFRRRWGGDEASFGGEGMHQLRMWFDLGWISKRALLAKSE